MAAKIRRDDEVIVLTGKDKGKRGKVKMFCLPANLSLKVSTRLETSEAGSGPEPTGGIVEKAAIQVSNVAIFNAATGKADRVGFRFEDGKKSVSSSLTAKLSSNLE